MKQIALITGGSSGLGYSFAKLLGFQGFKIFILSRSQEKLEKAKLNLKKLNIDVETIKADITNENDLKKAKEFLKQKNIKKIDFLILNAGRVTVRLLKDYNNTEEIKQDIETDLLGTIFSAYYFESFLQKGSKVLLISSGFGLFGSAGYTTYCAAKAGVINFADAWRRELISKGIAVYVAAPGDIDTPQYRQEIASAPEWMKKQTPRKVNSADFVAKKILKKTKGKYRTLIFPTSEVKFLNFALKILPRKISTYILDKLFPQPKL